MGLLVRERQTPEGLLVSVCDTACLGETYEEGEVSLDVTEAFYGGDDAEEADPDALDERLRAFEQLDQRDRDLGVVDGHDLVDALTRASVANIVGERSVSVAVEAGIVDEERVLSVDGTLHAQLVRM